MMGRIVRMGVGLILASCTLLTPLEVNPPAPIQAKNLMEGVTAQSVKYADNLSTAQRAALAQFSVSLFSQSFSGEENVLISPLSAMSALGMTQNGAAGNTLAQMEQVIGLPLDTLNSYLGATLSRAAQKDSPLCLVNSVWIKDDPKLTVLQSFLQRSADYYGADVYRAPFDDATLQDINAWVCAGTKNRIPTILDQIPKDAMMYLVNALSFDGVWQEPYAAHQVEQGLFTSRDGGQEAASMMRSLEELYLDDGRATGFVKPYAGGDYAFAALLPNEDVSIDDYIASLTGEGLQSTLQNAKSATVTASIPKFQSKFGTELSGALWAMGMTDLFDGDRCDLSGLGSYENENLCVSRVLHKTSITVDEKGTQAGAATVVEVVKATSMAPEEVKTVCLDRPFVYLIVDCATGQPLFLGCVLQLGD